MNNDEREFIQQQAHDWLVKLETGGMADGDEERFVEWLSTSDIHGDAFHQAEEAWRAMHAVNPEILTRSSEDTSESLTTRHASRSTWLGLAASVAIVALSSLWWNDAYILVNADHYTSTGQRAEITLEDGSRVIIDTDSAIQVDYTATERLLNVLQGQAHFAVAANPSKPFTVNAGDMAVTALGTAFTVRFDNNKASVVVTEHSVKVQNRRQEDSGEVLIEGQTIVLNDATSRLSSIQAVNLSQSEAWQQGKLVFQNKTLGYVVEELNRYYEGKIIISDERIRDLVISGVLDTQDPIQSLEELTTSIPIKLNRITPYVVLVENRY